MSLNRRKFNILIIDDSPDDRESFARLLKKHTGIGTVYEAASAEEGLKLYKDVDIDCILIDYSMPGENGIEALKLLKIEHEFVPCIMLTGRGSEDVAVEALKAGVQDYLVKDLLSLNKALYSAIENAIENMELKKALAERSLQLAAEKERLSVTLGSIGDGVISTDTKGHVMSINLVAQQLTGWSEREAMGSPVSEVFRLINKRKRESVVNPVEEILRTGKSVNPVMNMALITKDGSELMVTDSAAAILNESGEIIGAVLTFRDITEETRLEMEVRKAQKLESLGTLAGGIAHDFNNLLSGILGNVSLAKVKTEPSDDMYKNLVEAENAALMAKELTQQLLTFSIGGAPIRSAVSSAQLIADAISIVTHGLNIKHELSISDGLWDVEVDKGQFNQVIQNLVINADQAMQDGGTVSIHAENVVIDQAYGLPLADGAYVAIKITDRGIGISPNHLSKIFDPFFTTKQKGSGLGLATVFSIVRKHDGYVIVDSELGTGTAFTVYLPASKETAPEIRTAPETQVKGTGHILVMDDELYMREITHDMLIDMGYTIELAKDGNEAVQRYKDAKESNRSFDAVILDLTIPGGLGGKQTMKQLKLIDSEVVAIVSSGYSNDPIMSSYQDFGFKSVIAKPYTMAELGEALKSVLAETSVSHQ